jgi:hypothetical protein
VAITFKDIENRVSLKDAEVMLAHGVNTLTDEQVTQCYDAYATHISYLNADDYGGDWKLVPKFRPGLATAKAELDRRGLPTPSGYLI